MTPNTRRLSGIAQRAIDRAIEGGQHQVRIGPDGGVVILPLTASPAQVEADALDAEIRGSIDGYGDAAH